LARGVQQGAIGAEYVTAHLAQADRREEVAG
jgi:hypothetical protein